MSVKTQKKEMEMNDKTCSVRFPNEDHPVDISFDFKNFKPTMLLDKEVFGWYGDIMVAVARKDYDLNAECEMFKDREFIYFNESWNLENT